MTTEVLPPEKVHVDENGLPYAKLEKKEGTNVTEIKVPLKYAHVAAPLGDSWYLFIVEGGQFDGFIGLWVDKPKKK